MKFKGANRIAPDGTPRSAASHLGLFCLPMSHKKDTRLVWVKTAMQLYCDFNNSCKIKFPFKRKACQVYEVKRHK